VALLTDNGAYDMDMYNIHGLQCKCIPLMDWGNTCRNPTLGLCVKMQLTLPKVGKWNPPGLPKTQKTI